MRVTTIHVCAGGARRGQAVERLEDEFQPNALRVWHREAGARHVVMSNPATKDPQSLTVTELKELLRRKGKSTVGNKNELVNRLLSSNWQGEWLEEAINKNNESTTASTAQSIDRVEEEPHGTMADESREIFNERGSGNHGSENTGRCANDEREAEYIDRRKSWPKESSH